VAKYNKELANVEASKAATEQRIRTYELKKSKLDQATSVNHALREKLNLIDYLFLYNQDSVLPFFEDTLFKHIQASRLIATADSVIEVDTYRFKINMAMNPFNTLPRSAWFEDAPGIFPLDYEGERNGVIVDTPLNTQPTSFLAEYNIKMIDFLGTYEDVQDFIETLQTAKDDILITVHCFKNNESDNFGIFRTQTTWTIAMTVYFMNPEESAQGDNPPAPPGATSC
jgi:hypothetical protein